MRSQNSNHPKSNVITLGKTAGKRKELPRLNYYAYMNMCTKNVISHYNKTFLRRLGPDRMVASMNAENQHKLYKREGQL